MPLNYLIKLSQRKIFLPFYHTISDHPTPHISNLYPIRNTKTFEKDLDTICSHFDPISIERLCEIVDKNEQVKKPVFHLTFDDGLKEVQEIIAPILERKGIPATIFINSAFVDNKSLFYRYKVSLLIEELKLQKKSEQINSFYPTAKSLLQLKYSDTEKIHLLAEDLNVDFDDFLLKSKPYLTSEQIKNLISRGFTIGSHSIDHPWFKEIPKENQKNQISKSCHFLKTTFDLKDMYFSFPFSDENISAETINWIHQKQHSKLSFGTSGLKDDVTKYHLHRVSMDGNIKDAASILNKEYFFYNMKRFLNKNKITRQ